MLNLCINDTNINDFKQYILLFSDVRFCYSDISFLRMFVLFIAIRVFNFNFIQNLTLSCNSCHVCI